MIPKCMGSHFSALQCTGFTNQYTCLNIAGTLGQGKVVLGRRLGPPDVSSTPSYSTILNQSVPAALWLQYLLRMGKLDSIPPSPQECTLTHCTLQWVSSFHPTQCSCLILFWPCSNILLNIWGLNLDIRKKSLP